MGEDEGFVSMKYYIVPIPSLDASFRYIDEACQKCVKELSEKMDKHGIDFSKGKKEAPTMQVAYNGFTGELVKLERHIIPGNFIRDTKSAIVYDLSIYDSDKQVTHSFTGVKLEDVKFLGGAVAFGG